MTWQEKCYDVIHSHYKSGLNYGIPEHWLAGLISQECSRLDPKAARFEPHVYSAIIKAKKGITSPSFPGFNGTGKLARYIDNPLTTDDDLRALATSYGLGQIMGYHYYNKWSVTPDKFKNLTVKQSIEYTLRMMGEGLPFARIGEPSDPFRALMRWWNTGSAKKPKDGIERVHNPTYLDNAVKWAKTYKELLEKK
jgi:hypothetical protein